MPIPPNSNNSIDIDHRANQVYDFLLERYQVMERNQVDIELYEWSMIFSLVICSALE